MKKKKKNRKKKKTIKQSLSRKKKINIEQIELHDNIYINYDKIVSNDKSKFFIKNLDKKIIISLKNKKNKEDDVYYKPFKYIDGIHIKTKVKKKKNNNSEEIYMQVFNELINYLNVKEITEENINMDFKLNNWCYWLYT